MGSFIVGLDIGTSNIKIAAAENVGGRPVLRALFKEPSAGLRKGAIVDLSEATPMVAKALSAVKNLAKSAIKNVYVNIGTTQVKVQSSRGIVAVSRSDGEIYQDDIERAIKASQAVNVIPNRMIIHNVTKEYIVDGVGDIADPLGLSGNRLEVSSLIIDAFSPHVKNLMRVVELAGAKIGGMVFNPLLGSRAALSKNQKDLGVVLIDLGFGTTSISVYEENKLTDVAIFPVGAGNITNDLAVGLKIPVPAAESLKLHYGYALAREINAKEMIDLRKFSEESQGTISRRFISEIIEARLAEIFEFVNNELRLLGKGNQWAGGIVLIGGGAKLPGITGLAKQELKLSSQVGLALKNEWGDDQGAFGEFFEDPEFVNVLGLISWGAEKEHWNPRRGNPMHSLKNLLGRFLP